MDDGEYPMLHSESRQPPTVIEDAPGYRLVFYEYCISLVFITLRRPSRLYRVPTDSWGVLPGLGYTVVTLLLGWWGIPWGFIYTPLVLWTNLSGGREIATEELRRWQPAEPSAL
jgi:hypothetical protein